MVASDYDFASNRTALMLRAFRVMGVTGNTLTSLTAEQLTQAMQAYHSMVALWQADDIFLWALHKYSQSLSSGDDDYAAPTDPKLLEIVEAYLTINNQSTPLKVISWLNYQAIPDKTTTGDPQIVTLEPGVGGEIYVWPVPATTGRTLDYVGVQRLKDLDAATSNPALQEAWNNAIVYGLAADLCDEYVLDLEERQYLSKKASNYYAIAKKLNSPKTTDMYKRGAFDYSR